MLPVLCIIQKVHGNFWTLRINKLMRWVINPNLKINYVPSPTWEDVFVVTEGLCYVVTWALKISHSSLSASLRLGANSIVVITTRKMS